MNAVRHRRCGRAGCGERRKSGGRYCGGCFAAASRHSHDKHRRERNARRRDRAAERDANERARDSARAKLYVAISRGKLKKESCAKCGRREVIAVIHNPARWREVTWLCRDDRRLENAPRTTSISAAKNAAWAEERQAVLAAVAALPEKMRAELYERAARGPAGIKLTPDAPLFIMRLIRAYRALPNEPKAEKDYVTALTEHMGHMLLNGFLHTLEMGFQIMRLLANSTLLIIPT